MAKKKSSSSSSKIKLPAGVVTALVIAGLLAMVARDYLGVDVGPLNQILPPPGSLGAILAGEEVDVPGISGGGSGGAAPVQSSASSGDYFSVYFTTPANPDEGIRTGGNDEILVEALNGATQTIDIAAFEFNLQSMADALIAAHERGVRVRMVDDDEHTEDSDQMEEVRDAGIPVVDDERSALMHNKFIVIDSEVVFLGSMNFTENGVYRNNNNLVRIASPELASNYSTEFEEMFSDGAFGPSSPAQTPFPQIMIGDVLLENYFSPEDDPLVKLVELTGQAQRSIHFMSFSFTEDSLGEVVRERGNNGVEIMGIFEQRGANTEFSECNALLDAGHDVRLDGNPYTFHHKVIIIDGAILITGSFNYSSNATESNDENVLIVHDPTVAAAYETEFQARWAEAQLPFGGECLAE